MEIEKIKIEDIHGWTMIVHEDICLGFICNSCCTAQPMGNKSGWMTGKCWDCEEAIEEQWEQYELEQEYSVPEGDFEF